MTALEQRTLAIEHATKPELFFQSKKYRFEKKRFMPNMSEKTQKTCFFFRQVEMVNRCNLYQNVPLFLLS